MKNKTLSLLTILFMVFILCGCHEQTIQNENTQILNDYHEIAEESSKIVKDDDKQVSSDSEEKESVQVVADENELSEVKADREQIIREKFPKLPEKMLPIERPEGYKNPVLTDNVITETLAEVDKADLLMMNYGVQGYYDTAAWKVCADNWIPVDENVKDYTSLVCYDCYIYYAPALDTPAEFDEYFLQIITDDSLEKIKNRYNIVEVDGKMAILCGDSGGSAIDYKRTTVLDISYNNERTACVTVNYYDFSGEIWDTRKHTFMFSDDHGWRLDADLFGVSSSYLDYIAEEPAKEESLDSDFVQTEEEEEGEEFDFGYEVSDEILAVIEKMSEERVQEARELFRITEEEEKECQELFATLPDKMPPMERPEGYDNPVLTEHVVIETLVADQDAHWLMGDFGIQDNYICNKWEYYPKNWIVEGDFSSVFPPNGCFVYYAPAFDTEEKLDEYFLNIWTEETLARNKQMFGVSERNGRLGCLSLDGRHSTMVYIRDSTVDEIIYNDDGTATVIITEYAIPGDNLGQYAYILAFSKEYGWRFHSSLGRYKSNG